MIKSFLLCAGLLVSGQALADMGRCGPREELSRALEERYSEIPVAVGLVDAHTVMEVLARADGDSWTIIMSTADGKACIIAAGKAWSPIAGKKLGPKT